MGAAGVFASSTRLAWAVLDRLGARGLVSVVCAVGVVACGGGSGESTTPPVAKPVITKFSASRSNVTVGGYSYLSWSTSNATQVTLNNVVVTTQLMSVQPLTTTTYVLIASNSGGSVSESVTVAVGAYSGLVAKPALQVARETLVSDQQTIAAPPVSLRFYSDIDTRGSGGGRFQVQFTLNEGTWVLGAHPERALRLENAVTGVVGNQGRIEEVVRNFGYWVPKVGLSADGRTVFFNVDGHQDAFYGLLENSLLSLNLSKNTINGVADVDVSADALRIAGLKKLTTYGDSSAVDTCAASKKLKLAFQHFVAVSSPDLLAMAGVNGTSDEHERPLSVLSIDLVDFVTNIKLAIDPPAASVRAGSNRIGFVQSTPSNASFIDANTALLGKLNLTQNAQGLDIGMQAPYLLAGNADGAGLVPQTVASLSNGRVEASAFTARLTATNGLAVGSTVFLSGAANCAAAITGTEQLVDNSNAKGPLDLTIPTTGLVSSFGSDGARPVYVCYRVPANTVVPATDIATTVTLSKATGDLLGEQANTCAGRLTSVE